MTARFGIDTSILVRLATGDPEEAFERCLAALSLLIASGLGQLLGPTSVAFLTQFVFRDPAALGLSLSIAVLVFSLLAFAVLHWGLRHYRAEVRGLEAQVGAERS